METGYLNFHDEEHFSDFSLSLDQHNLLDDSRSSFLAIDDDFDYVESNMDTSGGLWGTEQELNGDMAVLPVSGVASVVPKIENMKEDFAKVLTDWQEHIGYLQASDMGEDIDMAELSMGISEKLDTDLPEDIFHNENTEARVYSHASPKKKRQRDFTMTRSPKSKTISESSSQDIDVIGLDSSEDLDPVLDLMHVDCDHATSLSDDIDCDILAAAARGSGDFDLASYITGDDDLSEATTSCSIGTTGHNQSSQQNFAAENILKIKGEIKIENVPFVASSITNESANLRQAASDNEDAVDVETVIEQIPVLEAGDVKSLLEQFEASEASATVVPLEKVQHTGNKVSPPINKLPSNASAAKARLVEPPKRTIPKPIETQDSKFHKNIRDSLPKEVIDRIKASARKKVISVIPALSSPKIGARSTRMQEAAATLSRTKLLKVVTNGSNSSSGRVDGSVQLDHDYCSSSGSSSSGSSSSASSTIGNSESSESGIGGETTATSSRKRKGKEQAEPVVCAPKPVGYYVPITSQKEESACKSLAKKDSSSKKDSGLESGEVSDASEETNSPLVEQQQQQNRCSKAQEVAAASRKGEGEGGEVAGGACTPTRSNNVGRPARPKSGTTEAPIYGMKIRSALATSILQLRKGVLTKTKSLETGAGSFPPNKAKQQMISVLKKPPNLGVVVSHPNESIVTTKNSLNDEVQNIIVRQGTAAATAASVAAGPPDDSKNEQDQQRSNVNEETKKAAPRRKLNLAEYRSRREQTRSDNSRTCSPIQPMTLVYIHHASTSTEPNRDDPDSPIWSEREIVSVLKPKADFEEEKNRPKAPTREMAVQTGEQTTHDEICRDDNQAGKIGAASKVSVVATEAGGNKNTRTNNAAERAQSEAGSGLRRTRERKTRRYRRRGRSSSASSRSRSRSSQVVNRQRSTSRSRNKNRSGRSRRCSRSRSSSSSRSRSSRSGRSNTSNPRRRRRISHRRSSVSSSSSSWSSRSRSRSRSTSRSRSRSLRSRSRSFRSRSRSRSSSRFSSCSRSSSRSNFGRSGDVRRKRRRDRRDPRTSCDRYRRGSSASSHAYRGWRRSTRSSYRRQYDTWYHKEKKRQMEERRVIYVGRLGEDTTKADLRRRFEAFGPVLDISVHFREHGDNYGFVTFAYKNDAYEAVEHGNDDPSLPRYDLSFGGRRAFCKVKYADLDGMAGSSLNSPVAAPPRTIIKSDEDNTFDLLLKEAKAKLRKRKNVARGEGPSKQASKPFNEEKAKLAEANKSDKILKELFNDAANGEKL